MRPYWFLLWMLCLSSGLSAQTDSVKVYKANEVNVMPAYPGGDEALIKELRKVNYPKHLSEYPGNHKLIVTFVVNEDGRPSDFLVMRSVEGKIDSAYIKLLKTLTFIPATKNGKAVKATMALPVMFEYQ